MGIFEFFNLPASIRKILETEKKINQRIDVVQQKLTDLYCVKNQLDEMLEYSRNIWKINKQLSHHYLDPIFNRYHKSANLREIYLTDLFPEIADISLPLGIIHEESGHANHAEMLYLVALAKLKHAVNIFEFGTFMGQTTYYLAHSTDKTHVYTLDYDESSSQAKDSKGLYFKNTAVEDRVTVIECDSTQFDVSGFEGKMDFIFIDGGHNYGNVKNDTEKAFRMLAPSGMIVWHDYAPKSPDVSKFISEFTKQMPLFYIRKTSLILHIDGIDPLAFDLQ